MNTPNTINSGMHLIGGEFSIHFSFSTAKGGILCTWAPRRPTPAELKKHGMLPKYDKALHSFIDAVQAAVPKASPVLLVVSHVVGKAQ
jgi:hypothetical protein